MSNSVIKNSFTVEDIHNIRYINYEKTKDMTRKEIIEYTRREAEYGIRKLNELKANKAGKAKIL